MGFYNHHWILDKVKFSFAKMSKAWMAEKVRIATESQVLDKTS